MKEVLSLHKRLFEPVKNSLRDSNNGKDFHPILDSFLDELGLKHNEQTRYIAYERIANLNEEPLKLYLDEKANEIKKYNQKAKLELPTKLSDKQKILNRAYFFVKKFYEDLYEKLIYEIEKESLLDDFHLDLLKGTFKVGKAFNLFNLAWTNHIKKQNEALDLLFDNDSEKVLSYLKEHNLLEKDENGNFVERSYSVLKAGKVLTYKQVFPKEVNEIIFQLQGFIVALSKYSFELAKDYTAYLSALKKAFEEDNPLKTYKKWQKVDEAWMRIKDDFQISHPLEFYEDKYRKAVAPEWDLRIKNEVFVSKVKENIQFMFDNLFKKLAQNKYSKVKELTEFKLKNSYLFLSTPLMFFGSYLNGLFSAQVVPNDEEVSKKYGKKIFAFPEMVLENTRKKPILKITKKYLGDYLSDYQRILDNESLFYKIYDIETIGHEFGHNLWLDDDTELKMNEKTGNFKNIEEFKATSSAFVAYFLQNKTYDKDFDYYLIILHIFRVVGLLKYFETEDILPYYHEALIHLDILFKSGVLAYQNERLQINLDGEIFDNLKKHYLSTYEDLALAYLEKKDAWEFLKNYVIKKNNISLPKEEKVRKFVKDYQNDYKKIGNEIEV